MLTVPAQGLEARWTDAAPDLVARECRGHPYLLQLLGSTTWRSARPGAGDVLDEAAVHAGIPEAKQQLDAMYRARWGVATPAEQAFVAAMAQVVTTDHVSRAQIAANLGQGTRAISVPRERLIEKGVIEPVSHGLVRFTMTGFAAWVRDRER